MFNFQDELSFVNEVDEDSASNVENQSILNNRTGLGSGREKTFQRNPNVGVKVESDDRPEKANGGVYFDDESVSDEGRVCKDVNGMKFEGKQTA